MAREQVPVPDLGDTRLELVHAVRDTAETMIGTIAGRTIRGLVATLGEDHGFAAEFRSTLVALRRREMAAVVQRGLERGELRADAPLDLVAELLIGPMFWRLLLTGQPLGGDFPELLVDAALGGLAPHKRSG